MKHLLLMGVGESLLQRTDSPLYTASSKSALPVFLVEICNCNALVLIYSIKCSKTLLGRGNNLQCEMPPHPLSHGRSCYYLHV